MVATGGVELLYQDYEVRAERVVFNVATQELVAEGGVVLDQGPRRMAGERLEFNFDDRDRHASTRPAPTSTPTTISPGTRSPRSARIPTR